METNDNVGAGDTGHGADHSRQQDAMIAVSVDRLRQMVPWILRDERYEKEALDADLNKLIDREDFQMEAVEAVHEAHAARFSLRWYSEALTSAQITEIARTFSFAEDDVKLLSGHLAQALNPDLQPATIAVSLERARGLAADKLETACKHLMNASEEALKALELVERLSTEAAPDRDAAARFDTSKHG